MASNSNALPWSNLSPFYFVSMEEYQKGANFKAKCLVCIKDTYISTSVSSSSNLRKHMMNVHPMIHVKRLRYPKRAKDSAEARCFANVPDWMQNYCQELYQPSQSINPAQNCMNSYQLQPCPVQWRGYEGYNMCDQMQLPYDQQRWPNSEFYQKPEMKEVGYEDLNEIIRTFPQLNNALQMLEDEVQQFDQPPEMPVQQTQCYPHPTDYRMLDAFQQQQEYYIPQIEIVDSPSSASEEEFCFMA